MLRIKRAATLPHCNTDGVTRSLCCSFTSCLYFSKMNGWINQHNKNGCPFCMFSSWSKPWKWFVLVRNKKKNQPISLNQEKSGNKLCFEVGHSCSEADLRWPWSNQGFSNCAQMNSHFLNETLRRSRLEGRRWLASGSFPPLTSAAAQQTEISWLLIPGITDFYCTCS